MLVFLMYSPNPIIMEARKSHFTISEKHGTSFCRRNQTLDRQVVSVLMPKSTLMANVINSLCLW